LLDIALDLDLVRACRLGPVVEGRFEPFGDEPLADPSHGLRAGAQGRDDVLVGVGPSVRGIREQEDAGMGQLAAGRLALGDQPLQRGPFLDLEGDPELLHRGAPSLEGRASAMTPGDGRPFHPSIEV
jgi:hypothetical protein